MNWQNSWDNHQETNDGDTPLVVNPPTSQSLNPYNALNQDALLLLHKQMQDDLTNLKAKEMELRKYIVARAFPQGSEGVNKQELGNGFVLKSTIKYNYVLDNDNSKVEAMLDKLAATDNEGPFLADRLVNWKATLSVSEYRKLDSKYKKIADEVITINDAAPTLEIVEPKVKK